MKDKLRELSKVERVRLFVNASDENLKIPTCVLSWLSDYADILDAEGDGGAVGVGKEAVLALINPLLSAGTFEAPDWAIRVAAICMDCSLAESPHPARSGVASDEDMRDAARYRWLLEQHNSEGRSWHVRLPNNGVPDLLNEAIDAAIKGERHEQ